MTRIRRAAVTGLFAIWLAPLSAGAQGQSASATTGYANGPATQVQSIVAESRGGRRGWDEQDAAREEDGAEDTATAVDRGEGRAGG